MREGFYEKHGVKVLAGERAITINRQGESDHQRGRTIYYDKLDRAVRPYPCRSRRLKAPKPVIALLLIVPLKTLNAGRSLRPSQQARGGGRRRSAGLEVPLAR